MSDQNDTANTTLTPVGSAATTAGVGTGASAPIIPDDVVAEFPSAAPASNIDASEVANNPINDVATKIGESHNILVALSSDPSVDELCSAIGLSLYLDRLGKRVAAIYSGTTPNALEFLNPEETFEQSADTLQDFVIALNKEKADHLRYKLDGDYVKIFITPYRSRIASDDLEFSYGDYNVDLVLALDVANGVDLDAALREHGRIMHDAAVVNITTGNPGKLGEIEWSDKSASSISEMIAELLYNTGGQNKMESEEATAFLTGIVAATNRFATAGTTARTMEIASRLMESGANQQLISKNITPDMENEFFSPLTMSKEKNADDPTKLDIAHGDGQDLEENTEVETAVADKETTLLDDLKAAEASLAASVSGVVTPEVKEEPLKLTDNPSIEDSLKDLANFEAPAVTEVATKTTIESAPVSESVDSYESVVSPNVENVSNGEEGFVASDMTVDDGRELMRTEAEKVIEPSSDFVPEPLGEGTNKYGQMLEDALAEKNNANSEPIVEPVIASVEPSVAEPQVPFANPAVSAAPEVMATPEINGVPTINYMPMPGDETLPPPPTPPIDFGSFEPAEPIIPEDENIPAPAPMDASMPPVQDAGLVTPTAAAVQPEPVPAPKIEPVVEPVVDPVAVSVQTSAPVADPAAFKIPGV